jgi:DNA-binding transcriptional LysR family regulator
MALDRRLARRLKLRDLYFLDTVVRLGSMGKAAVELAVSQPAVSKAITDLEHVLGVRVLDRSRQGVEPTRYGTALLKWSTTAFDDLRQGVGEISFLADPGSGEVRIGSTDVMLVGLIPAVIDRLSRQYPRMLFHIIQAPSVTHQYRDLRERNVDLNLGRVVEPSAEEDLEIEVLYDDQLFVAAGLNNKWHRRRKIDPAKLSNEPWVLPPYDSSVGSVLKQAFRARGLEAPRITVSSSSTVHYAALLATGRFLGLRAASTLRLSGKRLSEKALSVDLPIKPVKVGIATLKQRTISPAVQRFIECARVIARQLAGTN